MPSVLIVEDDADMREYIELLLSSFGYQTMTAKNGLEALHLMREHRPCLVLLDLMMPVMNGWQFREAQLQDPAIADVPVVCVTAVFDPVQVTERLKVRCIGKPVEFPHLLHEVEQCCGGSAHA